MTRLEELNAVRKMQNLAPLDKLPEGIVEDAPEGEATPNPAAETKPVTPANAPQAPADDKPEVKPEPAKAPVKKPSISDFSEEEILNHLKSKGIALPNAKDETPEEKQAKRDAQKMAWAFANGKISVKEQSSYNAEVADPENTVYREFLKDQKAEDPALTDTEIWDEFQKKYDLDADPNSRQYKTGQRLLNTMFDTLLKEKYPNVFKIDPEYSEYEAGENSRKETEEKITKGAPVYASTIEDIFTKEVAKVDLKYGSDSYSIDVPQEVLDEVKSVFLDPSTAINHVKAGTSKEELQTIIEMTMLHQHKDKIFENAVKQALDKHFKGIKGIPAETENQRPRQIVQSAEQIAGIRATFPNYQPVTN